MSREYTRRTSVWVILCLLFVVGSIVGGARAEALQIGSHVETKLRPVRLAKNVVVEQRSICRQSQTLANVCCGGWRQPCRRVPSVLRIQRFCASGWVADGVRGWDDAWSGPNPSVRMERRGLSEVRKRNLNDKLALAVGARGHERAYFCAEGPNPGALIHDGVLVHLVKSAVRYPCVHACGYKYAGREEHHQIVGNSEGSQPPRQLKPGRLLGWLILLFSVPCAMAMILSGVAPVAWYYRAILFGTFLILTILLIHIGLPMVDPLLSNRGSQGEVYGVGASVPAPAIIERWAKGVYAIHTGGRLGAAL